MDRLGDHLAAEDAVASPDSPTFSDVPYFATGRQAFRVSQAIHPPNWPLYMTIGDFRGWNSKNAVSEALEEFSRSYITRRPNGNQGAVTNRLADTPQALLNLTLVPETWVVLLQDRRFPNAEIQSIVSTVTRTDKGTERSAHGPRRAYAAALLDLLHVAIVAERYDELEHMV
ncbi:hypothetical protein C8R44DRAFT_860517 [Mycena epipterygia]|nr:hypothetical protein C8R44DRAFT_860517 [Mycena epipterygia]